MRITEVASTDLFRGTAARPLQVIRVSLANDGPGMISDHNEEVRVSVSGAGVSTPEPELLTDLSHGERRTIEVAVAIAAPAVPGSPRPVTAIAESSSARWQEAGQITVAEPGWTMWMVSHFHYDPVWWNTQGQYTQTWPLMPAADGTPPDIRNAFELVQLHLDEARSDPDYKFVLAEIDYLKPHFDAYPQDREDLIAFIKAGRIEIVGGNYNEPNTNLTCAESTIRNAVYGLAFQQGVLGANPTTAWMLDAFGFDPSYPGLMAAAGLAESSWARGPFHQWGPARSSGGNKQMQFPAEFEWLSPDGTGLLTSYMPNHYSAGWVTQHAPDLATAERDAYQQFRQLAPVSATRNVLLPVGGDHVIPSRWATAIHRDWNARYVWPRFATAVPAEFFAAVRSEVAAGQAWLPPQTRDMNPVYPGKDVTYIDTKQAQRDAEIAVLDGERLATLAWLAGAAYPSASLDKAWRLLVFGAHHDAITGSEGDQVYLDLLAGWREAFERGDEARRDAAGYLAGLADTASAAEGAGTAPAGAEQATTVAVVVTNTLSWARSGMARTTLNFPAAGTRSVRLADSAGASVDYLADGITRHPDGSIASVTLTFRATDVPPVGYRTYLAGAVPAGNHSGARLGEPGDSGWHQADGLEIENDVLRVIADPAAGGTLSSVVDKRTATQLLAGPGNELVLQEEHITHPRWGEGPWLLCPNGVSRGSGGIPAKVRAEQCPIGSRLVADYEFDDLRVTQETLLWTGADWLEFRTHVDGSIGSDRLLRARFPANVPGGLPVFQTGLSVIGRPPGQVDLNVAEHPYTLDNPAHEWFGVGSTARVAVTGPAGDRRLHAIGVAEVIAPAGPATDQFAPRDGGAGGSVRRAIRDLVIALARQGVTSTCSVPDGPRYGWLELDSNLPDCRISVGGPTQNQFTARVLAAAGPAVASEFAARLAAGGPVLLWVAAQRSRRDAFGPGADLRGDAELPVLIVAGNDLDAAVSAVIDDLADAEIEAASAAGVAGVTEPDLASHSLALLNRGLPGSLVTPNGTAYISLMRACSTWPCGIWIDGERRTVPDGSSFAWQHWSRSYEYALAAGPMDWRAAGFARAGQEYQHQFLTTQTDLHAGPLPASVSLVSVQPAGLATGPGVTAALMALKPRGNPLATLAQPDPAAGVTIRLRDLAGGGHDGADTRATVRMFTGIARASATSMMEHDDAGAPPADCRDGAVTVTVPPCGTVTVAAWPGADWHPAGEPASRPAVDGHAPEPAQPVFTRYWLHGKGPAPAGNMPVAVHLAPALVAVKPGQTGTLQLTVGCGPAPAAGIVRLSLPAGVSAEPAGDLHYDLAPSGFACWQVTVRVAADAPPGRRFAAAQIVDDVGQVLEDAVVIAVGEDPPPSFDLPVDELVPLVIAHAEAEIAEMELTNVTGDLELAPGGSGEISVRLANNTAGELRGEAQVISPHGTWALVTPWSQGLAVAPGEAATVTFTVAVPPDARPGERWWGLVKTMCFGRLRYSPSFWITVLE